MARNHSSLLSEVFNSYKANYSFINSAWRAGLLTGLCVIFDLHSFREPLQLEFLMKSTVEILKSIFSKIAGKAPEPEAAPDHTASSGPKALDLNDGWSWIPNWPEIFHNKLDDWYAYVEKAKNGPRVLMATCTGGNSTMTPLESMIAVGLTLRGAKVEFLLCDKVLPACPNMITVSDTDQEDFINNGPNKCDWCFASGFKTYESLRLDIHKIGDWCIDKEKFDAQKIANDVNFENIGDLKDLDVLLGHHAYTGTLRYFGRGDLNDEPNGLSVLRRYVEAGVITNRALHRLYNEKQFKHTVINQGIYVPQGVVVGAAKNLGSSVIVFDVGYRKKSIIIDDWSKKFEDDNDSWKSLPWNSQMEQDIQGYLNSRRKGTLDWIHVLSQDGPDQASLVAKELGIDFKKPTIALLTNVIWDAQVFYPTNAFKTMVEWMRLTIEYFQKRQDLQLLIRVHPGELQGFVKSRQLAVDEINKMFPKLPSNVFIIPPESPINTYAALDGCNAVLIYATTAGIELAGAGYPVVVAGEAWVRNKGFTTDACTPEEYYEILDNLPHPTGRIDNEKFLLAQKYAYHHYFRRMVPFEMLETQPSENVPYTIKPVGIKGFLPGADLGLDVICEGILEGKNFFYPYEQTVSNADLPKKTDHEFYTVGSIKA